ncbi:alpha/beta hydrolase [Ereboglobus luteus]|uniref:Alpha/beta hydrolase n=1 Tax=Ereboglobus luteus TaxID=1796921 RepID=A0A2U8E0R1_9BACT|nr:alpha/beta hydrolase [Ereboglobus luteus]AWI08172.1 alpha/beta hydrolase [Ereboglobus luteus]
METLRIIGIVIGAVILAGVIVGFSGCANSVFYYPTRDVYGTPGKKGVAYEAVTFKSRDGTKLSGWFMPAVVDGAADARKAKGTVIHYHGNSQNMTSHWEFVGWLPARGFNVLVFDYRGYGASEGRATQRGLFEDSQAALDYARSRPDVDATRLLVFGQSLGGTHAIAAVGAGNREGVRAVAQEATFYSYAHIANQKVPGGGLLIGNKYSAGKYVAALPPIPLLMIHGTADNVVPYENATRLFAAAREPKKLITINGGSHIDAMTEAQGNVYRDELVRFFDEALK